MSLSEYLESRRGWVEDALDRVLPRPEGPAATVVEAMRYAVQAGGKRLRPIIALAAAEACGDDPRSILEPVTSLELLHTYSLIHDDLPAMDDDDLRRGRPTAHRAFGEAEAILAGDALHSLAFEVLGRHEHGKEAVVVLARAGGIEGMVGGQQADMEAEGREVDLERLRWIHRHKTGALFAASAEIGALLVGAGERSRSALARYGAALGLSFQIADDILDCTQTAATLGKTPGKDREAGKATYPSLLGLDRSREQALELSRRAREQLAEAGLESAALDELAAFAIERCR